ncbi:MAG: ATPase, T2SS/T4P/T4SS family [Oscillospiraceae bacterium]
MSIFTDYPAILEQVQQHFSNQYSNLQNNDPVYIKEQIRQYIIAYGIHSEDLPGTDTLTEYVYHDMMGFSFITRENLFDIEDFEELNINSWDDVDIKISGISRKTEYTFLSPQHSIDIHQRMLRLSKTVIDHSMPRAVTEIQKNIRICVERVPIVDEDVGIASSIRKVRSGYVPKEELIKWKTANEDMLDFLLLCLRNGVSVCISGETGSGKTTLAGALIAIIAQELRTVTIEEGSREWDFRTRKNGRISNSVLHLKTREHEDARFNISQEVLVKDALRLDPDFLPIGEIRGAEAYEVMSASITGHTVITTVHSGGTADTPLRLMLLAKKAYDLSDSTLLYMASKAFPILVHIEQSKDNVRRVVDIAEVTSFRDNAAQVSSIFRFDVEDHIRTENGIKVVGSFQKVGSISKELSLLLLRKGASKSELERF